MKDLHCFSSGSIEPAIIIGICLVLFLVVWTLWSEFRKRMSKAAKPNVLAKQSVIGTPPGGRLTREAFVQKLAFRTGKLREDEVRSAAFVEILHFEVCLEFAMHFNLEYSQGRKVGEYLDLLYNQYLLQ